MELFFDTYETGEDVRSLHRAGGRSCSTRTRRRWRRRCCCSPRAASSSGACWSTPASGSRCSSATAPRCARRCRSGCRSTCGVDVEIQPGPVLRLADGLGGGQRGRQRGPVGVCQRHDVHITVGAGDTLSGLAGALPRRSRRCGGRSRDANQIVDPFDLPPGRSLVIPRGGGQHAGGPEHAVTEPLLRPALRDPASRA